MTRNIKKIFFSVVLIVALFVVYLATYRQSEKTLDGDFEMSISDLKKRYAD
jgi:hypothetical protein